MQDVLRVVCRILKKISNYEIKPMISPSGENLLDWIDQFFELLKKNCHEIRGNIFNVIINDQYDIDYIDSIKNIISECINELDEVIKILNRIKENAQLSLDIKSFRDKFNIMQLNMNRLYSGKSKL